MPVIDVDFVAERATVARIAQHLSPGWREHLTSGGGFSTSGATVGVGYTLPAPPYCSPDPPPRPGRDALECATTALDEMGSAYAVLDAGVAAAISGLANVVMAGELARATNTWLDAAWLGTDDRFLGSVVFGPRDPDEAANEIRRAAANPRMAQVVLASPPVLLGNDFLDPVYRVCEELGLPLELQIGGASVGTNDGPTQTGHPRTWVEYEIDSAYGAIPHLTSAVLDGLFDRFPGLRLVLSGFGIAWLPSLLWRLEPVRPGAAEIVHRHVRFTTRNLDLPTETAEIERCAGLIDLETLLIYSSGYPWPETHHPALDALTDEVRHSVRFDNAAAVLRLNATLAARR